MRSMVNYYELSDVYNKNSKENFKIYPLKDMDERLIRKHGRYYDPNSDMSQLRLEVIYVLLVFPNIIIKCFMRNIVNDIYHFKNVYNTE